MDYSLISEGEGMNDRVPWDALGSPELHPPRYDGKAWTTINALDQSIGTVEEQQRDIHSALKRRGSYLGVTVRVRSLLTGEDDQVRRKETVVVYSCRQGQTPSGH